MNKICMIGPDPSVMGGIASVIKGYMQSDLFKDYQIDYISSHVDGSKFNKLVIAVKAYFKFTYKCLFNKPDLVHIHSSFGPSFYRKAIFINLSCIFKIPVINHIHGAEFDKFYTNASEKKKKMVAKVYNKCSKIVVLSNEWKQIFKKIIDQNKIMVIENYAIIPQCISNFEDRENIVLFMGEVGKRKGAFDIPDVIEKVVSKINNVKFVICGNGEIEKVKEVLSKKELIDYVEFTGWIGQNRKTQLLQNSKVCFLPSYDEGLPMSILEGMAYGLPIVSTKVGGIPTVVVDGENGFINEPGNVNKFSDAIILLLNDKKLWQNISKNNIRKIQHVYGLDKSIDKLKQLYSEIILLKTKNNDFSRRINVAGVLIDRLSMNDVCANMKEYIFSNRSKEKYDIKTIQAANVDSIVKAHIDNDMKKVINKFDMVVPDGMPIVWASKILRRPLKERVAGPDLFVKFNDIANKNKFTYFLLGSIEQTLMKIIQKLKIEHPNINVIGYLAPPISDMKNEVENKNICDLISSCQPDIVWVSFGCPKQERWIIENKNDINASIIIGIGAAFEFYAGTIKRAPILIRKIGLEWAYRFLQEPKRLWKRYFVEGPKFFGYVIKDSNKDLKL